jgi:hypothetical protein
LNTLKRCGAGLSVCDGRGFFGKLIDGDANIAHTAVTGDFETDGFTRGNLRDGRARATSFEGVYPAATRSRRSRVSGYLRTSRTSAAAWGLGLARPCSHFSSVLSLIRNFRAKTAREQCNLFRVSRINFESTFGIGSRSWAFLLLGLLRATVFRHFLVFATFRRTSRHFARPI